jgi:hypothetical protein
MTIEISTCFLIDCSALEEYVSAEVIGVLPHAFVSARENRGLIPT